MNFAEMKKEQKQMLILAVGGVLLLFFIVSNLMLKPAKEEAAKAEEIITELETKVNRGEMVIGRDPKVRKQVREDAKAILDIIKGNLPPGTGRYGWALENITGVFEDYGVFFTLEELRGNRYIPLKPGQDFDPDSISMWIPYAVEVEFTTSFENLKKILNSLKEKFPYSSVANMQISASDRDPRAHNIQIILEWPVFRFEKDLDWIEEQAGTK